MSKLVLFDFDGVLADTLEDMLQYAEQACATVGGSCTPTAADLEALEVMDMYAYGRQLGVPEGDVDQFADTLRAIFRDKDEPAPIFTGMRDTVIGLGEIAVKAIITGNAADMVSKFLLHHGLQDYFQLVYSGDMPGSRTHKILRAMRDAGARSQNCCLVSDAASDMHAARGTGVRSVAVTWGYQSRGKLASAHPDAIAESPAGLADILNDFYTNKL